MNLFKWLFLLTCTANASIDFVEQWKTVPQGRKKFRNEEDEEGTFIWDLNTNTYIFKYPHVKIIVTPHNLVIRKHKISIPYPFVGITKLLKEKIDDWEKFVTVKKQIKNKKDGLLVVRFEDLTITFDFNKDPFDIKEIIIYNNKSIKRLKF
jgi:hypothetical protein